MSRISIEKFALRYVELTSESPQQSMWNFIDSTSIESTDEAFNQLYKDLPNYFTESEK